MQSECLCRIILGPLLETLAEVPLELATNNEHLFVWQLVRHRSGDRVRPFALTAMERVNEGLIISAVRNESSKHDTCPQKVMSMKCGYLPRQVSGRKELKNPGTNWNQQRRAVVTSSTEPLIVVRAGLSDVNPCITQNSFAAEINAMAAEWRTPRGGCNVCLVGAGVGGDGTAGEIKINVTAVAIATAIRVGVRPRIAQLLS
jgi:hypothetical protein